MNSDTEEVIQIWPYSQVPAHLKRLSAEDSEWVGLVPPNLVWPEVEELFLSWNAHGRSVTRQILVDG
jgi:hypothetical protein